MKNLIFKTCFPFLFFSLLISISHAGSPLENTAKTSLQNDQIIKSVHEKNGLIFATPPYWGQRDTTLGFKKLVKHIGNSINTNVALVVFEDYETMINKTIAGEVDLGFYGPALYVKAQKQFPALRYLATAVFKFSNMPSYYSYLIVKEGSGLDSIKSLEKKSFAFGSKESTGGYKYPIAWMIDNNIDPQSYFKSVQFLEAHNKVLEAVASGEVDAGAVSPGPLNKMTEKYGPIFKRIRKFGPIPASVIATNNKLPEKTIQKIIAALEFLPSDVTDVKEADYKGFKVVPHEAYDQLRRVMELTDSSLENLNEN